MRALTLHPPWAYLVPDPKAIETRNWTTMYRGWLAIHVGRKWDRDGHRFANHPAVNTELLRILPEIGWPAFPLSAIVAVGRIAGVIPTERFRTPTDQALWGDYGPGRYVWILSDVQRLRAPIDCPGKQGLWDVPEEIVAQIRAEWKDQRTPGEVVAHAG